MADREQRIVNDLERCLANIEKTKDLIEYHKNMLKTYESKANELRAKLDEVKMSSLCDMINKQGYDIDKLREAVRQGDFSRIVPLNPLSDTATKNNTDENKAAISEETTEAADTTNLLERKDET